jgi:glyoxylase-like metal-dependent hydrolase (beta-lactamase superfamily II)
MEIHAFPLGPYQTNCYVVTHGGACMVVDMGMQPAALLDHLAERSLTPERLVLTHAHCDHIAGLAEFRRRYPGVPVAIHPAEQAFLADASLNLSLPFGQPMTFEPADRTLDHGDALALGDTTWDVLHTPGHSPGGVTLHCSEHRVALVGDTLFRESVGRTDFPTSDPQALVASIRTHLYAMPDDTACHPGHGPTTTIGHEKRHNAFVTA